MKKHITITLAWVLTLGMLLSACAKKSANETVPQATAKYDPVVITVGSRQVKKSVFTSMYNYYAATYGVEDSEENAEMIQYIKEIVSEMIIEENVLLEMAAERGVALTDEEITAADKEYQDLMEDWRSYFSEQLAASETPPAEDALEAAIDEKIAAYMEENSYTYDYLQDTFRNASILDKLYEEMISDVSVSDEELQTYYTEQLAAQKEAYIADPGEYEDAASETTTLYHLQARKVRHILVGLTQDQQEEINNLRNGTEETPADTAAADAKLAEYLKGIEEEAKTVLTRVTTGGEDFGTVMTEVSDDTGGADGYLIAKGSTSFVQSFTDAAWALEKAGDISALVPSDYGYHIIVLDEETPEHETSLEDAKAGLEEALLESKRTDTYYEKLDAARAGMTVTVDYAALGMSDPSATAAPDDSAAPPQDTEESPAVSPQPSASAE
ncbi:MAG: peptidylprolyl isomerase [Eubacteriales bacterium]|nr:peptidylprolyl isomerase [Eubacteriales bacterium]